MCGPNFGPMVYAFCLLQRARWAATGCIFHSCFLALGARMLVSQYHGYVLLSACVGSSTLAFAQPSSKPLWFATGALLVLSCDRLHLPFAICLVAPVCVLWPQNRGQIHVQAIAIWGHNTHAWVGLLFQAFGGRWFSKTTGATSFSKNAFKSCVLQRARWAAP